MKRKRQADSQKAGQNPPALQLPPWLSAIPEGWRVAGLYLVLTLCATFPLVFSPFRGIYSPTDHISTDAYGAIALMFWWPARAIGTLSGLPTQSALYCAPFSQFISYSSLSGWFSIPVTLLAGPVFANNLLTWAGYFLSAFFAYLLAHHLTRNRLASALSGVLFAFCPYMLLRGYTTYDTIQAGWLPLYVLALFRFDEDRSWKNAGLIAVSLAGAMLLSFPYYFVFLPILTAAYAAVRAVSHHRSRRAGEGHPSFLAGLASRQDLVKLAAAGAVVAVLFLLHYKFAVQAPSDLPKAEAGVPIKRSIEQQRELRMAPSDYITPVQQSAVFGGLVKDHWQEVWQAERRNAINSAAYVGIVALALALYGVWRRRDRATAFLIVLGLLAFLTTLGPYLKFAGLEIPTPAWLMFQYAPFVRRINAYKVYVQLAVAVLAGVGLSMLLGRLKDRSRGVAVTAGLMALACVEYTITPPLIHTDLTWTPGAYRWLSQTPGDPIVLEYPMRKAWGASYQGYNYYQTLHHKRLFNGINGDAGNSYVPLSFRGFWADMEVPAAMADGNNQALLRHFDVKYVLKHHRVQSQTTILRSLPQPDFDGLPGLKLAYASPEFRREYRDFTSPFVWQNIGQIVTDPAILSHPHDYLWTDVYEVTSEPATVMLTWDYRSPYPSSGDASEYFSVHLSEPEKNFYPPAMMLFDGDRWTAILQFENACALREQAATGKARFDFRAWRMMRNDGRMEALNLLDGANDFDISFDAVSFETPRRVEVWAGDRKLTDLAVEPQPKPFTLKGLRLDRGQTLGLRFHALEGPAKVTDDQGGTRESTVAFHNFRVTRQGN